MKSPIRLGQEPLELVRVYFHYDVPRLFSAKDPAGALWLVHWVDEDEELDEDTWLAVEVSPGRLAQVEHGEVDLHNAFRLADGRALLIRDPVGARAQVTKVSPLDLPMDLFCEPGVRLSLGGAS